MNNNNKILIKKIKELKLNNFVKLLGNTRNIPKVMSGLDIHVLCSKSEAFPNVVAEAMACETPCIVTNVGDAAFVVGKTGWTIPPKNSIKLSKVIEEAINEIGSRNWVKRCSQARLRIKQKFGIIKMMQSYNKLWIKVCS